MNISHFFIDWPIFATVLSIIIMLVGGIALMTLPVSQYPDIVPPTVECVGKLSRGQRANRGGGNRRADRATGQWRREDALHVIAILERRFLFAHDHFRARYNLDTAQVLVQNRVNLALPGLPEEVRRTGVSVNKQSPSMILFVNIVSPDNSRDELYLGNYALLQVKDRIARINGVGSTSLSATNIRCEYG